jgi:hypothetical protein
MVTELKRSSLVNENVLPPTGRASIRFELEIWDTRQRSTSCSNACGRLFGPNPTSGQ